MKKYTIQGLEFTQDEMTIKKNKQLIKFLQNANIPDAGSIDEILSALVSGDVVGDFLSVVLDGDVDKLDIDEMTNSQLMEVLDDFLSLNEMWIRKLMKFIPQQTLGMSLTDS